MAKKLTDLNEAEYSVILEYVELYGITEEEALKTALTEGSITEHSASNFKYKPEGFLELKYYDGNNKSVFFKLNKELKKAKKTELFETDNFYLGTEVVKLEGGAFDLDNCKTTQIGETARVIINNISYKASRSAFDAQGNAEKTNFDTTLAKSIFPDDTATMYAYGGMKGNAAKIIEDLKKEYPDGKQGKTQEKVPEKFKVKYRVIMFGLIETEDGWKKFYLDISNRYEVAESLTALWYKRVAEGKLKRETMTTRFPAVLQITGSDSFQNPIIQAIPEEEYMGIEAFKEISDLVRETSNEIATFIEGQREAVKGANGKDAKVEKPAAEASSEEDEENPFPDED